jgi:hypothetical protein
MSVPDDHQPAPAVAQAERRLHPRYNTKVQIELHAQGSDIPMRLETTDLSRTGCYIVMTMPLPVGAEVEATLWLAEQRIRVRGRIVTRHPQFGNGIMFLKFEGDDEKTLRTYLDQVKAD